MEQRYLQGLEPIEADLTPKANKQVANRKTKIAWLGEMSDEDAANWAAQCRADTLRYALSLDKAYESGFIVVSAERKAAIKRLIAIYSNYKKSIEG